MQWTTLSSVSSRRTTESLDPLNDWTPPITSTNRVNGWSLSAVNDGSLCCLYKLLASDATTSLWERPDPSSLAFFVAGAVDSSTEGWRVRRRSRNKRSFSRTRVSRLLHCVTYAHVNRRAWSISANKYRIYRATQVQEELAQRDLSLE